MKKMVSSGSHWEHLVGYSRAVRVGNIIEVAGTTAIDGDSPLSDDIYDQSMFILKKIDDSLIQLGGSIIDVVRTRMYVTDISHWEKVAKAHCAFFGEIRPVTTMVEVKKLIRPDLLIEIEATAIIEQNLPEEIVTN